MVGHRTQERDGYDAVILGAENVKERKVLSSVLNMSRSLPMGEAAVEPSAFFGFFLLLSLSRPRHF